MKMEGIVNERVEPQQGRNSIEDLSSGFLNIHDIAGYLKVRVSTIYSLVERREIPHYRVGRQIRFRKGDIDRWLADQKQEVVDVKVEAKRVIGSLQKKGDLDINRIVKKVIEGTKKERYTSRRGRPDRIRGLGKEVEDGYLP
jgi:excisionase family DNA binding protein